MPPLNLVGDFGGGGMLLASGVLAALLEAQRSGKGQVVDAAMVDGAAALMHMMYAIHGRAAAGATSAAPTCSTARRTSTTRYETKDGKYVSVGSIEPQFYRLLLELTGLDAAELRAASTTRAHWPALKAKLAAIFQTTTRDEWCASWKAPTSASRRS